MPTFNDIVLGSERIRTLQRDLKFATEPARQVSLRLELSETMAHLDVVQALQFASEALGYSRKTGQSSAVARSLCMVGWCYLRLSKYRPAHEHLLQAYRMFVTLEDKEGQSRALCRIGEIYRRNGSFSKAYRIFRATLALARSSNAWRTEVDTLIVIGLADLHLMRYGAASDAFLRSMEMAVRGEYFLAVARSTASMGLLAYKLEDYDRAMNQYEDSLALFRRLECRYEEASILNNIGAVHTVLGDIDSALKYLLKAVAAYNEVGSKELEGFAMAAIAKLYVRQNKLTTAAHCERKALQLLREVGSKSSRSFVLIQAGRLALMRDRYERSAELLSRALLLALEAQDIHAEIECRRLLATLYQQQGNHIEALVHHRQYLDSLSLLCDRRREAIDRGIGAFNFVKRIDSHEFPPGDDSVPSGTIVAGEGVKLESELRERGRGTALLSAVMGKDQWKEKQRVELFDEVVDILRGEFIAKLTSSYPTLTPTELKVCSLLKVDLSTKEMARLMNISVHTIETHRKHIRKKMGIGSETSLSAFLMGL